MKVIIPNFAAPDSFVDNVAFTLRKMGHEVLTRPPRSNALLNSRVVRKAQEISSYLFPDRLSDAEQWLLDTATRFRPDLLICLTQSIREQVLFDVKRKCGVKYRVAWWGDTPANMRRQGLLCENWDLIFIKDPHGVEKFRRLGFNAHLLHEAMNPEWHKPLSERTNSNLIVAGSFYGYRNSLVKKLMDRGLGFELYGGRPARWCYSEIRFRHSGKFVVREEKSRVFGAGLGCLNSTALSEGNSINCRAFEIAGAGGFQIMEDRAIISDCFIPNKELVTFQSIDDVVELANRASVDKDWTKRIRSAGARRALSEHTYEHRLKAMLACVSEL